MVNLIHSVAIPRNDKIWDYSNPIEVQREAFRLLGNNAQVYKSMRPDKKYMILNPDTNKFIYFGQMEYEDFTKHNDEQRRERFRRRNHKWANKPHYTPAWLAYHLLW